MEIDERKIRILQAIIRDYIETAEPVGSRTIAKKYNLGISSATIRNEMADLEDMGYLEQIHSSSGRKPSEKGYRLYVDKLMEIPELSPYDKMYIKNQFFNTAIYEMDKMIRQASQILSELTNLICIVQTNAVNKSRIKVIKLLNISENDLLCVIVTNTGVIRNNVIHLSRNIGEDALLKLNNYLNSKFKDVTVEDLTSKIINIIEEGSQFSDVLNAVVPSIYEALKSDETSEVYLEGTSNIFNYPEYNDICRAKEFLSLINNKEKLVHILENGGNFQVKIGDEIGIEGASECSVISAVYNLNDIPLGSIGVIGPTRINYSKIISILNTIINEINESLKNT